MLTTTRLTLREFETGDYEAVHAYARDLRVVRYLPWGPNAPSDTRDFIRKARTYALVEPRTGWELAVTESASGDLLGGIGLHVQGPLASLGYCFAPHSWGRGVATEAARRMVRFAFETVGVHRIQAGCDPRNTASIRVLEKAGMRQEGHLREDTLVRGEWCDTLVFGVLVGEWKRGARER